MNHRAKAFPRILLIGADGQIGWELRRALAPLGEVCPVTRDGRYGRSLDLSDSRSIRTLVEEAGPRLVVNAAAYTAVDRAEEEGDAARNVNAAAPGVLGEVARDLGASVIHFSTDYIFSGVSRRPYREGDEPAPASVYGETKLAGEKALLETDADAVIFRTSWVYGLRGSNFLLTMRRLMAERPELGVVHDQVGAPTWSRMIAEGVAQVVAQTFRDGGGFEERRGIYHMTSAGETTWHGFAEAIRDLDAVDCRINPLTTSEYPTLARRPAYSLLNGDKLAECFGIRLPHWLEALKLCIEEGDPA